MADLLVAVGIAMLLASVVSAGYVLVLRELRLINGNLKQLIGLMDGARLHDEPLREPPRDGWNTQSAYRSWRAPD
jgi:hypothetical protein